MAPAQKSKVIVKPPEGFLEASGVTGLVEGRNEKYAVFTDPEIEGVWPHLCIRKCVVLKSTTDKTVVQLFDSNYASAKLTGARRDASHICSSIIEAHEIQLNIWKTRLGEAQAYITSRGKKISKNVLDLYKKSKHRRRRIYQTFCNYRQQQRIASLESSDVHITPDHPMPKIKPPKTNVTRGVLNPKTAGVREVKRKIRL